MVCVNGSSDLPTAAGYAAIEAAAYLDAGRPVPSASGIAPCATIRHTRPRFGRVAVNLALVAAHSFRETAKPIESVPLCYSQAIPCGFLRVGNACLHFANGNTGAVR